MGDIAHGALNTLTDSTKPFAGIIHDQTNDRTGSKKNQGQLPVGVQHEAEQTQYGQPFAKGDSHRIGRSIRDLLDVKGEL